MQVSLKTGRFGTREHLTRLPVYNTRVVACNRMPIELSWHRRVQHACTVGGAKTAAMGSTVRACHLAQGLPLCPNGTGCGRGCLWMETYPCRN